MIQEITFKGQVQIRANGWSETHDRLIKLLEAAGIELLDIMSVEPEWDYNEDE